MPPARHLQQRTAYHGAKLWNAFGPVVYFGRARTRGGLALGALGLDSDQAPRCAPTPPPHFALAWKSWKMHSKLGPPAALACGGCGLAATFANLTQRNVRLAGPKIVTGAERERQIATWSDCASVFPGGAGRRSRPLRSPMTFSVSDASLSFCLPSVPRPIHTLHTLPASHAPLQLLGHRVYKYDTNARTACITHPLPTYSVNPNQNAGYHGPGRLGH